MSQVLLTEGRVSSLLLKLTLPMIWGSFTVIAFNLADTYFVGQIGTAELAAMTFTFPVVLLLGNLAMGLGIGVSSVVSRAVGEGDPARVKRLTMASLTLSLVVVGVFVLAGLGTIEPLFTLLGVEPEILPLVRDYMQIWYLGMVFLVVPMVGNSIIRATGDAQTPSLIMTLAAFINILLDPLLIFGWGPFPALELQGAALATVIARAMTLVASLLVLGLREKLLLYYVPSLHEAREHWRRILQIGFPAALTRAIVPLSMGFITSIVAAYGPEAIAGFGIALRVESFALIVPIALPASIGPFVGQNWGAQRYDRIRQALKLSFRFSLIFGVFLAVTLASSAGQIATLFNSDPEVVRVVTIYLIIAPIGYGAAAVLFTASSVSNALGRPLPAVVMSLVQMLMFYVPLAYIGSWLFGLRGIFIAACLANLIVGFGALLWSIHTCFMKAPTSAVTIPVD
ncbi:MAG: MATE family efflux transporter [Cyanobacteria bacterium J06636_16]